MSLSYSYCILEKIIFGIGLARTATHTLSEVLNQLGVPCVHNPSREALRSARFAAALGPFAAACDASCAAFYAELATEHPHALFVCTIRSDATAWERSCVAHFGARRCGAGDDSARAVARLRLYGSANPTAGDLRRARARHANEVAEFFAARGRTGDLLMLDLTMRATLNLTAGEAPVDARWLKLWRFIARLPPSTPLAQIASTLPPRACRGRAPFPWVTDATQREARRPCTCLRRGRVPHRGGALRARAAALASPVVPPLFVTTGYVRVGIARRRRGEAAVEASGTVVESVVCRRYCVLWAERRGPASARLEVYRTPARACAAAAAAAAELECAVELVVCGCSEGCTVGDAVSGGDAVGGASVVLQCAEHRWFSRKRLRAGGDGVATDAPRRTVELHLASLEAARDWACALRLALLGAAP